MKAFLQDGLRAVTLLTTLPLPVLPVSQRRRGGAWPSTRL